MKDRIPGNVKKKKRVDSLRRGVVVCSKHFVSTSSCNKTSKKSGYKIKIKYCYITEI